jgi:hypothetical protein
MTHAAAIVERLIHRSGGLALADQVPDSAQRGWRLTQSMKIEINKTNALAFSLTQSF